MYYSDEVYKLRSKAILCAVVFIFIVGVGLLFIFNRFGVNKNVIIEAIKKEESFVLYFTDQASRCSNCAMVKKRLDVAGVSYYEFDIHSDGVAAVLEKLNVSFTVRAPSVFVINKGKMAFNIIDIKDQNTIDSFIEYNKLTEVGE